MSDTTITRQIRLERRLRSYWRVTFDHPPLNIFGPETIPQLIEKLIFNNARIAQPTSASSGCDLDCKEELFRSPVDRSRLSILQVLSDRAKTLWRDLTTEPVWKYEELPPFRLSQLTKLDLFEAGDSELARVIWFWCYRPKLIFHDSASPIIVALCVLVYLFVALVNMPGTSIPERVAEMLILLLELAVGIYLIGQRIRFVRWRHEYELSIDRLIRTIHPGSEGGSAIEPTKTKLRGEKPNGQTARQARWHCQP